MTFSFMMPAAAGSLFTSMKGLLLSGVILTLFVLIVASPLTAFALDGNREGLARGGVLDLRSDDPMNRPVTLGGTWGFYWNQLVYPTDSLKNKPDFEPFPVLWKNLILHGRPLPSYGYATYALTVLLPRRTGSLAMDLPDCYSSFRLFVNGKLVCSSGSPDTSAAAAVPHWLNQTIVLPDAPDTLHLLLQVANFWHSKGGPYKAIRIGSKELLAMERQRDLAVDFVLTGCLLMGGLFFMGLYMYGKHDKATFYFALFCILYSYRVSGTSFYSLHSIFPTVSWFITLRLEYLSLFLSISCLVTYVRYLYPQEVNLLAIRSMNWFCLSFAGITLLTAPVIFTRLINPFVLVMFSYIAYTLYVYIQAARHSRIGSLYALLSMGILMVTFTVLNLEYLSLMPRMMGINAFGYIAFFFLQSLILSFRFSYDLKQSKQLAEEGARTKSEFLSSMSHEIRTPLNSVIGMTHLLLMNETREDQKEQLNVLLFSANNLLSIVNDILDYHKIEAGKVEFEAIPVRLPELASNIIAGLKAFAREKNIELCLDVDPGLIETVSGDPTRLCQVINNLVHNAIKFTHKGSVWLRLKAEGRESGFLRVRFSVEDTGIGISPEKQRVVFDEFVQADSSTSRSYGGTGLGLAISKKLLSLQGSELQLKSELGKGSVFYFRQYFPIVIVKAERAPESLPEGITPLAGMSILLVEDNPLNVLVTTKVLNRWGAVVDNAGNGQEALDKLDPLVHRLILMDMHMPVMDGYTATLRIREMGLSIPIIALTASVSKDEHKALYSFYIDEVVTKPFHPDQLLRVILKCLRKSEEV
jgi:signal transduction histidine kinase/CheY-like chemotaxis protein